MAFIVFVLFASTNWIDLFSCIWVLCSVLLLCLAWRDVKWGPWWSQRLGKQVHPHHQTSLTDNIKAMRMKQEIHWNKTNRTEHFWRTNETRTEEKIVTCSMSGCSGLYSGLVSTCSGTNPIFLKMWRDSCSLIGPRWRLQTFLSSKK